MVILGPMDLTFRGVEKERRMKKLIAATIVAMNLVGCATVQPQGWYRNGRITKYIMSDETEVTCVSDPNSTPYTLCLNQKGEEVEQPRF